MAFKSLSSYTYSSKIWPEVPPIQHLSLLFLFRWCITKHYFISYPFNGWIFLSDSSSFKREITFALISVEKKLVSHLESKFRWVIDIRYCWAFEQNVALWEKALNLIIYIWAVSVVSVWSSSNRVFFNIITLQFLQPLSPPRYLYNLYTGNKTVCIASESFFFMS